MGKPSDKNTDNNNTPAEDKVDQAVKEQKDLLAEFQKIADELNNVLANLEGSTLVKRLKAASREAVRSFGGNRQPTGRRLRLGRRPAGAAKSESRSTNSASSN